MHFYTRVRCNMILTFRNWSTLFACEQMFADEEQLVIASFSVCKKLKSVKQFHFSQLNSTVALCLLQLAWKMNSPTSLCCQLFPFCTSNLFVLADLIHQICKLQVVALAFLICYKQRFSMFLLLLLSLCFLICTYTLLCFLHFAHQNLMITTRRLPRKWILWRKKGWQKLSGTENIWNNIERSKK